MNVYSDSCMELPAWEFTMCEFATEDAKIEFTQQTSPFIASIIIGEISDFIVLKQQAKNSVKTFSASRSWCQLEPLIVVQ